jgi:hypothetical protein
MTRHILSSSLAYALLASSALLASAQCDPGPAAGGGINRCYEDGYVRVDMTGNAGGYTWYWGYQYSSQIQNGYIVFHSRTTLNAYLEEVLTDTYSLWILSPLAPYSGGFQGPGPVIPDAPVSRSTSINISMKFLAITNTATNSVVIYWPSPSAGWALQQNADLDATSWTSVLSVTADDGSIKSVTVPLTTGSKFYRLIKSLP